MSAASDDTVRKHSGLIPFVPGQSGNPAGRPKGARNKLGEAFLEALQKDFAQHGEQAVVKVREEKPDQYLKVIASLMPKEMIFRTEDETDGMTDEQLVERIRRLQAAIAPFLDSGIGSVDQPAIEAPSSRKPH